MSFFSNFFKQTPQPQPQEKAKSEFTDSEVQTVVAMSERLVEVINESLQISNNSKNIDTKLSRLTVAKEKLNELKEISKKYPFIVITQLSEVELSIKALELEFELAGYRAIADGNSEGSRLEKGGYIDQAIVVYESLLEKNVDTPFTYRRLVILYRKLKRQEDELRVLDIALNNIPVTNTKHHQWFSERLQKISKK